MSDKLLDYTSQDEVVNFKNAKVKNFNIRLTKRNKIKWFIEKWHYSQSINGVIADYNFMLTYQNTTIGAMIYGKIAMANVWKKYVDNEKDLIELRRLCCIDDTPTNTESYFIGYTLNWLKKNTNIKKVISYADEFHNHKGIIYQASNFDYLGMTSPSRIIVDNETGKTYHDKTIRTKYKGKLKPFAKKLKNKLEDGIAHYKKTPGKHIYMYDLESRR